MERKRAANQQSKQMEMLQSKSQLLGNQACLLFFESVFSLRQVRLERATLLLLHHKEVLARFDKVVKQATHVVMNA